MSLPIIRFIRSIDRPGLNITMYNNTVWLQCQLKCVCVYYFCCRFYIFVDAKRNQIFNRPICISVLMVLFIERINFQGFSCLPSDRSSLHDLTAHCYNLRSNRKLITCIFVSFSLPICALGMPLHNFTIFITNLFDWIIFLTWSIVLNWLRLIWIVWLALCKWSN